MTSLSVSDNQKAIIKLKLKALLGARRDLSARDRSQRPAYVLEEDSTKSEELAKKYAKSIEVKPGEIIIPLIN